jgi:SagB-type dehydrogenase family enzyme
MSATSPSRCARTAGLGSRASVRYRRTPHLVCHWDKGQFILHNYATGTRAPATSLAVEILDLCEDWRARSDLESELRALNGSILQTVLTALVEQTFLEQSEQPVPASSRLFSQWDGWRPVAAYFHAATKDARVASADFVDARLRNKARTKPPPAPLKASTGRATALPPPAASPMSMSLSDVLQARRTWRQFGTAAISQEQLGTMLGMTWGVQRWVHVKGFGRMPLKTSPSGGARHSIEAYAFVRKVKGLRPGWYHYDPDRHALIAIPQRAVSRRRKISDYLPAQPCYDTAAVMMVMTAIFARVQWRYNYARAYRAILAEAGHLAQTFCLLATSLNLAPFCTMALADSLTEKDLGIDGVSESVIYAAGVGQCPPKMDWAPWPNTKRTPAIELPTWKRALTKRALTEPEPESNERRAAPRSSTDRAARTATRARRARRG